MLFTILLYQGWAISKISCYNISNYHDNQYYHNVIIANYNSVISIKIVTKFCGDDLQSICLKQ